MDRITPRFVWGDILPATHVAHRGPGYQFYHLVPLDVMQVTISLGLKEYTTEGVEEAIGNLWPCVNALVEENVGRIILGGAPVSSQLGRPRVQALLAELKQRTGIDGDGPLEAVIAGMHHLGLTKMVVCSRWADQLNNALKAYLEAGDIEVVGMTTRGQWGKQAFGMSFEEGLRVALEVGREGAKAAPQAEAILVPGGAAMSIHVIPALEEEFGKPVLTNLNAEVWNGLVHPKVIAPVQGWGKLLATA